MISTLKRVRVASVLSLLALALTSCSKEEGGGAASGGKPALNIWWFQWAPADGLQELGKEFEKETGIEVKVTQIPIDSYQTKVFLEFGNKQTGFDIVVGDSQWI